MFVEALLQIPRELKQWITRDVMRPVACRSKQRQNNTGCHVHGGHVARREHCSKREGTAGKGMSSNPQLVPSHRCGHHFITTPPFYIVGGADAAYRDESAWFVTYMAGTLSVSNTICVMRSW